MDMTRLSLLPLYLKLNLYLLGVVFLCGGFVYQGEGNYHEQYMIQATQEEHLE